jgi:hypothetical protein
MELKFRVETAVDFEMLDDPASKVKERCECRSLWVKVGSEKRRPKA